MKKSNLFFLLTGIFLSMAILLAGCGKENLDPIYKTEKLQLKDVKVEIPSTISPTVIKPDAYHQFTQIIGWIPIIGGIVSKLFEFPLDLTLAVFPPPSSVSNPELPPNNGWTDPSFLKSIRSIYLQSGYIRITPKELRGPDYKPELCAGFPFPTECPDVEFDSFLKEVRLYLIIKNDITNSLPLKEPEFLLAKAEVDKDYNPQTKVLKFNMTNFNLISYMSLYDRFQVKIVASGLPPSRKVYLDGALKRSGFKTL